MNHISKPAGERVRSRITPIISIGLFHWSYYGNGLNPPELTNMLIRGIAIIAPIMRTGKLNHAIAYSISRIGAGVDIVNRPDVIIFVKRTTG